MPPSPVERSLSMTDVEELTQHYRLTYGHNLHVPFLLSAVIGYDDKKSIFNASRPPRNANSGRGRELCFLSHPTLRITEGSGRRVATPENVGVDGPPSHATTDGQSSSAGLETWDVGQQSRGCGISTLKDFKDVNSDLASARRGKTPPTKSRSLSDPPPPQTKLAGEPTFALRNTKSLLLLPHLRSTLGSKKASAVKVESELVVKFPEKSILSLAQGEDDGTQLQLSCSSIASPTLQNNTRRRKGDSGVHISDEAVLTWRREDGPNQSELAIPLSSPLFSSQSHIRRVSTKSSLQFNYIPSLENVMEEPLDVEELKARLVAALPSWQELTDDSETGISEGAANHGWREIGEVVVSHWTRADQQQSETRLEFAESNEKFARERDATGRTTKNCSSANGAPYSVSLVDRTSGDAVFLRPSTIIKGSVGEAVVIQKDASCCEEQPHAINERSSSCQIVKGLDKDKLGPALLCKQAWLNGTENTRKTGQDKCIPESTPSPPPYTDLHPSSSPPRNVTPASVSFPGIINSRTILELRGASDASTIDFGSEVPDSSGSANRIVSEMKKIRGKCKKQVQNTKLIEHLESWHKQETKRITDNVDSWNSLEHEEKTVNSREHNVQRLLTSLRESIDAIFLATTNKVAALINSEHRPHETNINETPTTFPREALFRWRIKTVEDERDSLYMENVALKERITQLETKQTEANFKEFPAALQGELGLDREQKKRENAEDEDRAQRALITLNRFVKKFSGKDLYPDDDSDDESDQENELEGNVLLRRIVAETGLVLDEYVAPGFVTSHLSDIKRCFDEIPDKGIFLKNIKKFRRRM